MERGDPLSAKIDETLTLPEFSVEGGEGIDDGTDRCYALSHGFILETVQAVKMLIIKDKYLSTWGQKIKEYGIKVKVANLLYSMKTPPLEVRT